MQKIKPKERKVYQNVFDKHSHKNIFKLITEGYFDGLGSPVSIGKEANIFIGEFEDDRKPVIVKIYRLETCNFNKMFDYIRADTRYLHLKKRKREIVFAWTQREYRNLLKAREAGITVPTPYTVKDNIIVMELIGDEDPAPRLNVQKPKNPKDFSEKVVQNIITLWKHGLVHGDLSAFNILNHNEQPVFIDFSQSTLTTDPNAETYLKRDLKNVATYFKKQEISIKKQEIISKLLKKK